MAQNIGFRHNHSFNYKFELYLKITPTIWMVLILFILLFEWMPVESENWQMEFLPRLNMIPIYIILIVPGNKYHISCKIKHANCLYSR